MADEELPETVSIAGLAELFGVSTRQARNLLDAANVKPVERGRWPLVAGVRAVLATAKASKDPDDYSRARARAVNARAAALELTRAEKERVLVPQEEADAAINHVVAAHVETWAGLPAMITRDVRERARIEVIVKKAQGQVAKRLAEAARILREGGELPDAD